MKLNINDDKGFDNVDAETIQKHLIALEREEHAILSKGDNHYVQTLFTPDGGYIVEFRAGSYKHHFALRDDADQVDLVVQIFLAYFNQTADWSKAYDWVIIDFDEDFKGADDLEPEPEYIDIQAPKKEH